MASKIAGKKPVSIDAALYDPKRTERAYKANIDRTRSFAKKPPFRYRLSKLNQPGGFFSLAGEKYNPHFKYWMLLFLAITLAIGFPIFYSQPGNPLFHSYIPTHCVPTPLEIQTHLPCGDPFTNLWDANDPNSNGDEYNLRLVTRSASGANCGNVVNDCLLFNANSTDYALAVSKTPVDLSTISGKELIWSNVWGWNTGGSCCTAGDKWGWFLTRNNTLPNGPQGHSYDPFHDRNVVLIESEQYTGVGTTFASFVWIQRDEQTAVANQDSSFSQGYCSTSTDCFLTATTTSTPAQSTNIQSRMYLNYTGNTDNSHACGYQLQEFGPGCSSIQIDQTHVGYSQALPFLVFQGIRYFIGFYAQSGLGNQIFWTFDISPPAFTAMSISITTPTPPPTVNPPPPTIDTGGFFGPLIRALYSLLQIFLSIGVYLFSLVQPLFATILTALASLLSAFITIIFAVVKAILNAIGTAIGLPNLGDNIFTLLSTIAAWFTTFFADAIANISNIITFMVNTFNAVTGLLATYWSDLVGCVPALKDFLGPLWTVAGLIWGVGTFAGPMSISLLLSFWVLFGVTEFLSSWDRGIAWYNTTGSFLLLGFAITWYFVVLIINHVIVPIATVVTSMSTSEEAAKPNIEVMGTGGG